MRAPVCLATAGLLLHLVAAPGVQAQDRWLVLGEVELYALRYLAHAEPDLLEGLSYGMRDLLLNPSTLVITLDGNGECYFRMVGAGIPILRRWNDVLAADHQLLFTRLADSETFRTVADIFRRKSFRIQGPTRVLKEALGNVDTSSPVGGFLGREILSLEEEERNVLLADSEVGQAANEAVQRYLATESEKTRQLLKGEFTPDPLSISWVGADVDSLWRTGSLTGLAWQTVSDSVWVARIVAAGELPSEFQTYVRVSGQSTVDGSLPGENPFASLEKGYRTTLLYGVEGVNELYQIADTTIVGEQNLAPPDNN